VIIIPTSWLVQPFFRTRGRERQRPSRPCRCLEALVRWFDPPPL